MSTYQTPSSLPPLYVIDLNFIANALALRFLQQNNHTTCDEDDMQSSAPSSVWSSGLWLWITRTSPQPLAKTSSRSEQRDCYIHAKASQGAVVIIYSVWCGDVWCTQRKGVGLSSSRHFAWLAHRTPSTLSRDALRSILYIYGNNYLLVPVWLRHRMDGRNFAEGHCAYSYVRLCIFGYPHIKYVRNTLSIFIHQC